VYYDPADSLQKTLFLSHFPKLVKGDSAVYYVRTSELFQNYFQTPVPDYCKNDSLIKVEVGIKELVKEIRISDTELSKIRSYIETHKLKVLAELPNKIFVLERSEGESIETVAKGKLISVDYKGRFLNDSIFDDPAFPLQFSYGAPDQVLKGLNFVIKGMHKGEFIKIILPSYLAYGDNGNTNGTVAPFTPLLYEITITDIK
jgi:FKBP-type peptidyl-prolyl cis-trans isomerase